MVQIYNPYNIDYGSTITQNFIFYDSLSKVTKEYGGVDDKYSKKITPDNYLIEMGGYDVLNFSLSTQEEMDNRPLKEDCIINLSSSQSYNMTQVQIDFYYEQEKNRCFDSFKYAQNKTFQFISFFRFAYSRLVQLFGDGSNYFVKFGDNWLDLNTGLFYTFLTQNGKKNVFLNGYYTRDINDYRGTITDTYYIDISSFFTTIDFYKMKESDYYELHDSTIRYDFNLYPINRTINPDTNKPFNSPTNFQYLYYQNFNTEFKVYTNQVMSKREYYELTTIDGFQQWVFKDTIIARENKKYSIEDYKYSYVFYSDCGLVMYVLEPLDFDLHVRTENITYYGRPDTEDLYHYRIDNIYFRLKFFALPEFEGFSSPDLDFLNPFIDKPKIDTCCLFDCFNQ